MSHGNVAVQSKSKATSYLFALLLIAALLRLISLSSLPPAIHVDEAFIGIGSRELLSGQANPFSTTMSSSNIALFLPGLLENLFGPGIWAVRLPSVLWGIALVGIVYTFANLLYGRGVALRAGILACTSHVLIAYSRLGTPNMQGAFLLILSVTLAERALTRKSRPLAAVCGVITALGLFSYTGTRVAALLVILWATGRDRKTAAALFIPWILGFAALAVPAAWIATSTQASFFLRESETLIILGPKGVGEFLSTFAKHFYDNIAVFGWALDRSNQYQRVPLLDPGTAILIGCFFVQAMRGPRSSADVLLCALTTLLIALVSLTIDASLSARLVALVPFLCIMAARIDPSFLGQIPITEPKRRTLFVAIYSLIIAANLGVYFYYFPHSRGAFYQWFEPASSIAREIRKSAPTQVHLGMSVSTPPEHVVLRYLTPGTTYTELRSSGDLRSPRFIQAPGLVVLPFEPPKTRDLMAGMRNIAIEQIKAGRWKGSVINGIGCRGCSPSPLAVIIDGTSIVEDPVQ